MTITLIIFYQNFPIYINQKQVELATLNYHLKSITKLEVYFRT